MESHLGARLLNRTTRRVSLTEIGRVYFERCKEVLNDIDEIESLAGEQTTRLRGTLTISAPTTFGIRHLHMAIPEYLTLYPDVQLSLSLSDRFIDVVSEGFDLVIRIAELEDSTLIARKIAPCKRVLCVSPDYLKKNGIPNVPQDQNSRAPGPCTVSRVQSPSKLVALYGQIMVISSSPLLLPGWV